MCQEGGSLLGVTTGPCWFLTVDLKEKVICHVISYLIVPQGRYPENFMLTSLLEVCQECGVIYGGTWRTLRVPDQRLEEHGHP